MDEEVTYIAPSGVVYTKVVKHDEGKWRFSLVPPSILKAIASVREDGIKKYKDPEGWKQVSVERYYNAMMRHIVAMHENRYALDPETGRPHAWHVACNLAFMLELMSTLDDQQWKM